KKKKGIRGHGFGKKNGQMKEDVQTQLQLQMQTTTATTAATAIATTTPQSALGRLNDKRKRESDLEDIMETARQLTENLKQVKESNERRMGTIKGMLDAWKEFQKKTQLKGKELPAELREQDEVVKQIESFVNKRQDLLNLLITLQQGFEDQSKELAKKME
ncbi:hypothetical protein RFI_33478, partial [Reticulomyxa filosa]